jgi:hypothetical protein
MTAAGELMMRQCRVAARLGRLFRSERRGALQRWPDDTVARLVERRGRLVADFLRLENERRTRALPLARDLHAAFATLAREIEDSLRMAEVRAEQLRSELRLLRGEGMPSGVRGNAGGRMLGHG